MRTTFVAALTLLVALPHAASAQRESAAALPTRTVTPPDSALPDSALPDSGGDGQHSAWRRLSTNQRVAYRARLAGITTATGFVIGWGILRTQRHRYYFRPESGELAAGMLGGLLGATLGAAVPGDGAGACAGGARSARGLAGAALGTIVGSAVAGTAGLRHRGQLNAAMLIVVVGQAGLATLLEGDC